MGIPHDFDEYCKEMEALFASMTPEEFFDYLGIPIDELPPKKQYSLKSFSADSRMSMYSHDLLDLNCA
ncbi:hypothetical protein B5G43_04180 [Flavonifractor sp. An92]|uniref:hypothetical protein n=1 Tax=Flavonifractor sp. An92 TaxID=1965666 RepID=UPI000B370C32|nr:MULTISPECIES: hypothetical protein [unclassified Flavonifractor]OUN07540.1 hypothetical protein B5G43_04180 [Flavonifractor sp. An92]OUQ22352.1 hypothetical protein B5E80_14460 [Flavonifractor sp. An135]